MIPLAIILHTFASSTETASPTPAKKETHLPSSENAWRQPDKGAHVYLIGEFLYWSANIDTPDFAYKAKGTPGTLPLTDVKIKAFDIEWNPGFRVGLGYRLPHDHWEARGYVTQFRTTNHLKQAAGTTGFIEPNFGQLNGTTTSFAQEEGNWHLKYTLFDVELTRSFAATKALSISPFIGARGAWIHQKQFRKFSGEHSLHVDAKNHYRAGGLRLGSDCSFYLMNYVWFFGQASLNLLSGRFEDETEMELDHEPLFTGNTKPQRLAPCGELRAGAKGTIPLYRKEAFLTIGLTYDMSLWFFQNQFLSFFNASDAIQVPIQQANLTLQGVTLTTRLDF
jgi:Legionella pneumophila major outer membrane protein precursor